MKTGSLFFLFASILFLSSPGFTETYDRESYPRGAYSSPPFETQSASKNKTASKNPKKQVSKLQDPNDPRKLPPKGRSTKGLRSNSKSTEPQAQAALAQSSQASAKLPPKGRNRADLDPDAGDPRNGKWIPPQKAENGKTPYVPLEGPKTDDETAGGSSVASLLKSCRWEGSPVALQSSCDGSQKVLCYGSARCTDRTGNDYAATISCDSNTKELAGCKDAMACALAPEPSEFVIYQEKLGAVDPAQTFEDGSSVR